MHARGWRQLPNYAIWAGIGSFVKVCKMNVSIPFKYQHYFFQGILSMIIMSYTYVKPRQSENKCVCFHCAYGHNLSLYISSCLSTRMRGFPYLNNLITFRHCLNSWSADLSAETISGSSLTRSCFSSAQDMFIILTSSCSRCLPRSRGYRALSTTNGTARGGGSGGRGSRNDDENRLIDQLDEDWDE